MTTMLHVPNFTVPRTVVTRMIVVWSITWCVANRADAGHLCVTTGPGVGVPVLHYWAVLHSPWSSEILENGEQDANNRAQRPLLLY